MMICLGLAKVASVIEQVVENKFFSEAEQV